LDCEGVERVYADAGHVGRVLFFVFRDRDYGVYELWDHDLEVQGALRMVVEEDSLFTCTCCYMYSTYGRTLGRYCFLEAKRSRWVVCGRLRIPTMGRTGRRGPVWYVLMMYLQRQTTYVVLPSCKGA
jgi:hypothetical protein